MMAEKEQNQRNGHYGSFQDSLNEEHGSIPFVSITVRRTNSTNDISRFYRYFDLIESNSGSLITWKTYLGILQDQLRSYETLEIMNEVMTRQSQESLRLKTKKRVQSKTNHLETEKDCVKMTGDTFVIETSGDESLSDVSDSSNISIYTRARLLKTICTETKMLAEKICKTVEKISRLPKRCSKCGGRRGSRHFKQCEAESEMIGDTFIERADAKKMDNTKAPCGSKASSYISIKSSCTKEGSTSHSYLKMFNPLKKSSFKRLTYFLVKH